jgi:hypothetical protein
MVSIVWIFLCWTSFSPLLQLVCYYRPNQKFQLRLHRFLPHILLLWHILEPFNFSSVNVNRSDKFLNPIALNILFEKLQTLIPSEMNKSKKSLSSKTNNHSVVETERLVVDLAILALG